MTVNLLFISWKEHRGSMIDLSSRGCSFAVLSLTGGTALFLSKPLYPLFSTGSTQEDPSKYDWKIVDREVKNPFTIFVLQMSAFCVCYISSSSLSWKQKLSTPYCLQYRLPKNISRWKDHMKIPDWREKDSDFGGFEMFCLIWFFTSHQQSFSYIGMGLPGLNQY